MTRATFLLSKDPDTTHGGDLTLARVLMSIARESMEVDVLCLSATPWTATEQVRKVAKPEVALPRIVWKSLRTGRSLVHARFDVDALAAAIGRLETDVVVADHSYIAEPYLRSGLAGSSTRLVVNTVISESLVWRSSRGLLGRIDAPRIWRDELRVARAAHSVGTYDAEEARIYRDNGVERVHWLDITLPPHPTRVDAGAAPRRLVFLGDRTWPPNQEAFELLARRWPAISAGIEGAELVVVGKPSDLVKPISLPPGITDVGFADDLDALLDSCRGLVAPILTGGGVRVKILDAASRGLPIVSTTAGVGSLAGVFGLGVYDDEQAFIERSQELLLDAATAARESSRLYAANADRWDAGMPQRTVQDWLAS